jgi:hypothetical protein
MDEVEYGAGSDRLESFWQTAKVHARLNPISAYFGPTTLESVRPADWSYGETPDEANAFSARMLSEGEIDVRTPLLAFGEEATPEVGTLSILCDGQGDPVALVAVERVSQEGADFVEHLTLIHPKA